MLYTLAKAECGFGNIRIGKQVAVEGGLRGAERAADAVRQTYLLHQTSRNLAYEARYLVVGFTTVQPSCLGIGHDQLTHGAGDAHVGQATFFFKTTWLLQAHLVREQAFLHAHQEHVGELQAFGTVQGHQLHTVLVLVSLRIAGF